MIITLTSCNIRLGSFCEGLCHHLLKVDPQAIWAHKLVLLALAPGTIENVKKNIRVFLSALSSQPYVSRGDVHTYYLRSYYY